METKQIVILLLSLLLFAFEWVIDRRKKSRAKNISGGGGQARPPVAASASPSTPLLRKVHRAVEQSKVASPEVHRSPLPEEGVRVTAGGPLEIVSEPKEPSSEPDDIEELRKAIVWSEILQTKF